MIFAELVIIDLAYLILAKMKAKIKSHAFRLTINCGFFEKAPQKTYGQSIA